MDEFKPLFEGLGHIRADYEEKVQPVKYIHFSDHTGKIFVIYRSIVDEILVYDDMIVIPQSERLDVLRRSLQGSSRDNQMS